MAENTKQITEANADDNRARSRSRSADRVLKKPSPSRRTETAHKRTTVPRSADENGEP